MKPSTVIFLDEFQEKLSVEKMCALKATCSKPVCTGSGRSTDSTIRLTATYQGKNWGTLKTGSGCIIFPRINNNCKIEVGNRNLRPREYSTNEDFLSDFSNLAPYNGCPNAEAFLKRFQY